VSESEIRKIEVSRVPLSWRRTVSTASLTSLTAWNLSNVISASVRFSLTPLDEGAAHVDAHLLDVAVFAVVGFEVVGELAHGFGAAAVGDVEHAASVDVDEQRDVVVADRIR